MSSKRVAIVEDDVLIAYFFHDICTSNGMEVVGMAHQTEGALDMILAAKPDFVLMDVRLGGKRDGVDIGMAAHEALPGLKLVYITGSNEPPSLQRIRSDNPYKILIKPVLPADIIEALA